MNDRNRVRMTWPPEGKLHLRNRKGIGTEESGRTGEISREEKNQRQDPPGSPEARLLSHFLVPRDWV